jgi:pilus assembly protein CpaE
MSSLTYTPEAHDSGVLSIMLIGPDENRRVAIVSVLAGCSGVRIQEISSYPTDLNSLSELLEHNFDAVIIDLDSDQKLALNLVEHITSLNTATVMVYSEQTSRELVVRSMCAGAREFLTLPLGTADMSEALSRVARHRPVTRITQRNARKLFVFLGTKGGCGVTTIASNFAILLAQESAQTTLLIDLGLPLGDAAINLGIVNEYSTLNALQESDRLDACLLSSLVVRHKTGLYVLAAPGELLPPRHTPINAIDKLLAVVRQNFDYTVVDAGSRLDLMDTTLFEESAIIYLITQVGVTELRNANRLISFLFATRDHTLQVVLNRYIHRSLGIDEEQITKALTRPADWKIPDAYATARRTWNTSTPIALIDSNISRAIRQMARSACGLPVRPVKEKGFFF